MRGIAFLIAALAAAAPAAAQPLVESEKIDAVSVTLYRGPGAAAPRRAVQAGWPQGYALITETRTISIPAGRSVIRFVGVAEGMMPETAIVTGLPRQPNEKNRDARLLSPAALIDAYLKRRVFIRRTNRATGKVTEGEAIVESGPQGGVLLTTAEGVEALGCSGLPESLSYPGVPADLAAKPTLSIVTDSPAATTATVQLSYLAQGFDWSANYVVRVDEAQSKLDLFAWLTVVNGGSQGFADARTNAVAGAVHKEAAAPPPRRANPVLTLQCWPMDITSTHDRWGAPVSVDNIVAEDIGMFADRNLAESLQRVPGVRMAAPPPPPMVAQQEELGDLKLYRIPEPVTVAAQSQKQVAMIVRHDVAYRRLHVMTMVDAGAATGKRETVTVLRLENKASDGLGLPLPSGGAVVYGESGDTQLVIGETSLTDRAVGEEFDLPLGTSSDVQFEVVPLRRSRTSSSYRVTVTNAHDAAEPFELSIPYRIRKSSAELVEHKGVKTWRATLPANGSATIELSLRIRR